MTWETSIASRGGAQSRFPNRRALRQVESESPLDCDIMLVDFYTLVAVHALIITFVYACAYLVSERVRAKKILETKEE